ncbi:MAG: DEAD/DEAH box helicase, partial [bacterium]
MKSFQDLGLSPTLTEALAAEGLATPFELQQDIIPLIARNNNLLVESGPGSGTLIAYAAPLLEKIDPGIGSPGAIILTPTRNASSRLAKSVSRLSISTGHSVSALGGNWASPESSDILFGTPHDLLSAINGARLTTQNIGSIVVDGANSLEVTSDLDAAKELLGYIGNTTQKVIFSLPVTDSVKQMVAQYVPKCLEIPGTQKQV